MGASLGGSGNSSNNSSSSSSSSNSYGWSQSYSGTKESAISQEQLNILRERESLFNSYFFPQLTSAIEETTNGSATDIAAKATLANTINTSYNAANQKTQQTLAQQGLAGDNGVSAALMAANDRSRASALAQAYQTQKTNNLTAKASLLSTLGNYMPTATTDTGYLAYSNSASENTSSSSGKSSSSGSSWGWGASAAAKL